MRKRIILFRGLFHSYPDFQLLKLRRATVPLQWLHLMTVGTTFIYNSSLCTCQNICLHRRITRILMTDTHGMFCSWDVKNRRSLRRVAVDLFPLQTGPTRRRLKGNLALYNDVLIHWFEINSGVVTALIYVAKPYLHSSIPGRDKSKYYWRSLGLPKNDGVNTITNLWTLITQSEFKFSLLITSFLRLKVIIMMDPSVFFSIRSPSASTTDV